MDLSIVIVNWNSGSYLLHLLESLESLRDEVVKILVVDNGSTDSSQFAASGDKTVELRQFQDNQGFARAANLGIGATDSQYVLLLNPDIRILPETVRRLSEEMEKSPRLGIACGALIGESGEPQESFQLRSLPTITSVLMETLFIDEVLHFFKRSGEASQLTLQREPFEVEQPAAAFWLMRRDAWKEIGGFDENFFPAWFEDVDFCKRLSATSWKIVCFPQWSTIHRGGLSLQHLSYERFLEVYYSNLLKYWKKHHRWSLPLIWLPVRFGILMRKSLAHNEKPL